MICKSNAACALKQLDAIIKMEQEKKKNKYFIRGELARPGVRGGLLL